MSTNFTLLAQIGQNPKQESNMTHLTYSACICYGARHT